MDPERAGSVPQNTIKLNELYVGRILESFGLLPSAFRGKHLSLTLGDESVMTNFLEKSGFIATSAFARFMLLVVAERRLSDALALLVRKFNPSQSGVLTRHEQAQRGEILNRQTTLKAIRQARQQIGTEIFGGDADQYQEEIRELFLDFARTRNNPKAMEELQTRRTAFYQKVREDFSEYI